MKTPQGINTLLKDLPSYIRSAECSIVVRILADHRCNDTANQLLFVFTQTNNVPWFGTNDIHVKETKTWPFCFITKLQPAQSRSFFMIPSCTFFFFHVRDDAFQTIYILRKQLLLQETAFSQLFYFLMDIGYFIPYFLFF